MPDPQEPSRRSVSLQRLRWLERQLADWTSAGAIRDEQAALILGRYETADRIRVRRAQRIFAALVSLAVLLCAAGVLLLVGYNWAAIPRIAKVAAIFAAVIGAFAGSARAYSRGRPLAGEVLAFSGTLLQGTAIWLLAQVFHIESHYPEGAFWWMACALATAAAAGSRLIAAEAIVLLAVWCLMETAGFERPSYLFLPFAGLSIALAYRLDSYVLTGMTAAAGALWVFTSAVSPWHGELATAPLITLLGCAYYGAGLLHGARTPFGRTWHVVALVLVIGSLVPQTIADFYREAHWYGFSPPGGWEWIPLLALALGLLVFTAAVFTFRRRRALLEDWPVLAAALAAALGFAALLGWRRLEEGVVEWVTIGLAILSSAVLLALSVWLIVRGVRLDRALSFFTGIATALAFVLVRWVDLMGDMVSTSILFFVSGGVLIATAWYWKKRRPARGGGAGGSGVSEVSGGSEVPGGSGGSGG